MLPVKKSHRILTLSFITLAALFALGDANAKRFTIPKDSDVLYRLNSTRKEQAIAPEKIKILVWNMYKGAKESWAPDFLKITKDVDILMLQEILTSPKMLKVIKEDSERSYFLATSFFDKRSGNARSGVATASKFAPTKVGWQRSKYREPLVRTPKMTGITRFDLRGTSKDLLTVNIHAINFVSTRKLEHMIHQGLKAIASHSGPAIFAGDFNTWSKKKLRMMRRLMKKYSMKEVSFANDGRMKTFGNTLDHVFVRDLKITKSKVYNDIEGSDHKAMYIEAAFEKL
jgi:endonuclease/exonuclease/phosphatase (EEP) superfamily protein YafD